MSERASSAIAKEPATKPEPMPIDLSAEYESAEVVAEGHWAEVTLPMSGKPYRVKVSRATGPHFAKAVSAVNRKYTKAGRRQLSKLSPEDDVARQYEIAARSCFHDFAKPVLIKAGTKREVLKLNTLGNRIRLLSALPDLYSEIDELCGLSAVDFAEAVAEVGEG